MSDDKPRAEWVFPEPRKSRAGRVWLIVVLAVVAVALVVGLLWFFLPRGGDAPEPTPRPTATATATPTPTPTATPTVTPTATPDPTPTEAPVPPPVPDPDRDAFAAQVDPRLSDAERGLGMLPGLAGADAGPVVDQLQLDAQRLAEFTAPSSIADMWRGALDAYAGSLATLRSTYDSGADASSALAEASSALAALRATLS